MTKVALFASTPLALTSVQYLAQKQLLGVVILTHKQTQEAMMVEQFLHHHQIPYFRYNPEQIDECLKLIEKCQCDLAIVNTFSILPEQVIEFFKDEIFNIHPSKLPSYRGRCPLFWQLKNQETESALTLHRLIPEVDAGDIILQEKFNIEFDDTLGSLHSKLSQLNPVLLDKFFEKLEKENSIEGKIQDGLITDSPQPTETDLKIDWQQMTASQICDLARAANPGYGGARILYKNSLISILEATESIMPNYGVKPGSVIHIGAPEGFIVATKDGSIRLDILSVGEGVFSGLKFADKLRIDVGEQLN